MRALSEVVRAGLEKILPTQSESKLLLPDPSLSFDERWDAAQTLSPYGKAAFSFREIKRLIGRAVPQPDSSQNEYLLRIPLCAYDLGDGPLPPGLKEPLLNYFIMRINDLDDFHPMLCVRMWASNQLDDEAKIWLGVEDSGTKPGLHPTNGMGVLLHVSVDPMVDGEETWIKASTYCLRDPGDRAYRALQKHVGEVGNFTLARQLASQTEFVITQRLGSQTKIAPPYAFSRGDISSAS